MCPFQNHLHISKHAGRAGFFHCTSFYEISLLNSHPLILITQVSDSLSRASSISLKSSATCQEITGSKSSDPTLQKCWMTLVFIKLCTLNWNFVLWELVIKKTTMDFPLHKGLLCQKNNACVTLLKRGCSVWITQNGALGHRSLNWMSYLTGYLTPEGQCSSSCTQPFTRMEIHPSTHVIWARDIMQKISLQSLSSDCPRQNNKTKLEIPKALEYNLCSHLKLVYW